MNRAMSVNRAQSLASDQDINDSLAEIELQKLQRQYRIMEGDRKAYSEESRILITKQRQTIDSLKKENVHYEEELKLIDTRNEENKRKNSAKQKKTEDLAEQSELYKWKLKQLAPELAELNSAIAHLDKDIDMKRAELGGVNAASENCGAISKQIKVLENRLDKALVKFNKSLAVNKGLRATIDNLRRERLVFDNIYKKFERDLMEQKKAMAEIIEASNSAYEARDEAQAKIIFWREKVEKEHQAYTQEIKELDRAFEQDRKLKEFMAAKASDRMERILENNNNGSNNIDSQMHKFSRKTSKKNKDGVSPKFSSQESLSESLQFYEKAFTEIKKVTGISDMEGLVQRFKAVEDTNFSLFNYVNETNNEIENLTEETAELQRKIDGMKVEGIRADEERKKVMGTLEQSLTVCNDKNTQYEKNYTETLYSTSEIRKGVERLLKLFQSMKFTFSGHQAQINNNFSDQHQTEGHPLSEEGVFIPESNFAPTDSIRYALSTTTITDSNLIPILGVLEHKMNEIMTLNYMFNSPRKINSAGAQPATPNAGVIEEEVQAVVESDVKETVVVMPLLGTVGGLLGEGPIAPIGNLSIVAPSTGDDHESEDNISDDDDRPFTREELKQKTLKGISKRERANGQSGATTNKKTVKKTKK